MSICHSGMKLFRGTLVVDRTAETPCSDRQLSSVADDYHIPIGAPTPNHNRESLGPDIHAPVTTPPEGACSLRTGLFNRGFIRYPSLSQTLAPQSCGLRNRSR
jgi:hypothetical protein